MTAPRSHVDQLIADAKLVAAYGARTGRLHDSTLMSSVAEAETALAANQLGEAQLNKLSAALNEGVQAISPVTLLDLGSTWRPYPDTRPQRIGRIAFAVFAVLLIFVTSYYTQTYTQANAILGQLTDIQSRNAHDKAERLFRLFVENHDQLLTLSNATNDAVVFEPYLRSYSELFALSGQIATYSELSTDLASRRDIAGLLRLVNGSAAVSPFNNPSNQGCNPNYRGPQNEPVCMAGAAQSSLAVTAPLPVVTSVAADSTDAMKDKLDDWNSLRDVWLGPLSIKQALLEQFLYLSGVDASFFRNSPLNLQIYDCQQILTLLGFWLLPALYGLLGATVFQMRAILNPLVPDPSPARLFLRLALGGFAGISIFLLFGPERQKFFEGTSTVIGTFGLAFLFGFSIDVFFGALDHLVGMVSQSLAQQGKYRRPGA